MAFRVNGRIARPRPNESHIRIDFHSKAKLPGRVRVELFRENLKAGNGAAVSMAAAPRQSCALTFTASADTLQNA